MAKTNSIVAEKITLCIVGREANDCLLDNNPDDHGPLAL